MIGLPIYLTSCLWIFGVGFSDSFTRIFRPIVRALSIQKRSEIVKNEHARYTLERFQTDNAHIIRTKKCIGKYGIMY
jgi:hypothetical protein